MNPETLTLELTPEEVTAINSAVQYQIEVGVPPFRARLLLGVMDKLAEAAGRELPGEY